MELSYRLCTEDDVKLVYTMEAASYPEDEAATEEKLQFRCQNAQQYFMVGEFQDSGVTKIAGFVCGTLTSGRTLKHETMSAHNPDGDALCIHSVCVDPALRRRKLGTSLLKRYIQMMIERPEIKRILLISKQVWICVQRMGSLS